MKKTICLFLIIVICFAIMPNCYASADAVSFSDDPKAIQVASNSVIMLSCYDKDGNLYATGSAFAAFEEGIFLTNCHVVEGNVYSIMAQLETGLRFNISSVVAYDVDRDIAILRTEEETGLAPLPLGSTKDLERGEKVIAIGSPLGLINTLSIGLYSGTIEDDKVYLQFSAAISHGSSGGALFNNRGEVVGITSASFTEGQNLNLAIPIESAVELWDSRVFSKELSISDFYKACPPALPRELMGIINVKTLTFEEFKKESSIADELGLGEQFNQLLVAGYRFYKVVESEELSDRDLNYYLSLANQLGFDDTTANKFIKMGYRFYFYEESSSENAQNSNAERADLAAHPVAEDPCAHRARSRFPESLRTLFQLTGGAPAENNV